MITKTSFSCLAIILMLHFNDGHVRHHQRGEPRSAEKVFTDPLEVVAASRPESYTVTSADDPAYLEKQTPLAIGRKSKGTDFAWFVDKWENGRAINARPDYTKEHWLYLELPTAMQPGRTYTVNTGRLAKNGTNLTLTFDLAHARSEAVHVNTLGYVPGAPEKYAYVYHWMGDRGSLDLKGYEGRAFHLIEMNSYYTHLRVAQELLLVYEMGPGKFRDRELNLPESGNGVPDILDEAAWLPRFCQRLRAELQAKEWGTGGVGLRVAGDAFGGDEGTTDDGKKVGQGSWEDTNRIWMVSGEDPWSTYRCSPMGSEFTIHQNIGPAAAIFGFLCADERK